MKIIYRFSALCVAVLLLGALVGCDRSESTTAPTAEVVSEHALEYVNQAIERYTDSDFKSKASYTLSVMREGETLPYIRYAMQSENLIKNSAGSDTFMRDLYLSYGVSEPSPSFPDPTYFSTCYLLDGVVYHQYDKTGESEQGNFYNNFEHDSLAHMGLYSIGGIAASSTYAVKQGKVLRVDLSFTPEDCAKTQQAMIRQLLDGAFYEDELDLSLNLTALTFSAQMDAESYRLSSYSLTFTAYSPQLQEGTRLEFSYTEDISDYGTTEEIPFPDFSGYTDNDPKE